MKSLITGITGFVGSHLAELLLNQGHEVYGTIRWRSSTDNINHIKNSLKLEEADLRDSYSIEKCIRNIEPDYIFHLAAQSFVPTSFHAPQETIMTNITGTVNLLEAVRNCSTDPIIQIAGSSEEYGLVHEDETPIKETNQLRPLSPYAVSKVAQDLLGYQYYKSYGMNIIRTRSFNIIGPRSGEKIVTAAFAKQIAEIEKNGGPQSGSSFKEPVIKVGNLEASRDFVDVRDVASAYLLAVDKCQPGEVYNICSEKAWKIQQVLDTLLAMSDKQIRVEQDPERMRPSDVPILLGSSEKFRNATGWKPQYTFEQSMNDILAYWRQKV